MCLIIVDLSRVLIRLLIKALGNTWFSKKMDELHIWQFCKSTNEGSTGKARRIKRKKLLKCLN